MKILSALQEHKPERPYNVAHVLIWETMGGTEQATLRVAQALQGDWFNSTAFCLDSAQLVADAFRSGGIATASWEREEPDWEHWRGFLYRSKQLAREFKRRRIDLVHCSDYRAGNYAALAAKLARLPVLCHVWNRDDQISPRDRRCLRAVDKFIFCSRDTWRHFGYRVPAKRGLVVYYGIEVPPVGVNGNGELKQAVLNEFGIPPSSKLIGMVARVSPQKDYLTLAKAAARVVAVRADVRFIIIGDHSIADHHRRHYEEVQRALAAQGVTDYFTFTGYRTDVERLLQALDIFVLSTHYEGLPLAILEAMAQAKPVVATAVDGIPEAVSDGQTGLLYPHEDDAQLAAHLLALLYDPERAAAIGRAGRQSVEVNFSKAQWVANTTNLYLRTLQGRL